MMLCKKVASKKPAMKGVFFKLYLYYNYPYGHCPAYFWSSQTEFWADRFAKCLKMFHLTYFLYYKILAL